MKLTRSLVAIAALTTMSFAGGDIIEPTFAIEEVVVPVEPVPEPIPEPVVIPQPPKAKVVIPPVIPASKFYVAGGITDVAINPSDTANFFSEKADNDRQIGFTGRLGYDFMDFLGAELRGTYGIAKDNGQKFKQIGAYLKPNYSVTDDINLYGLLGASKTNADATSQTGFSYGGGVDYDVAENVSVFTDVVNYMKKSDTVSQWGLTLGAAYHF